MRTLSVARRILRQLLRDKRTLALMLVAPLGVLWLLSLVFHTSEYHPRLALFDVPQAFSDALVAQDARVQPLSKEAAQAELAQDRLDAIVSMDSGKLSVEVEGSDPSVTRATVMALQRAGDTMMPFKPPQPDVRFLHGGKDMRVFDNFGPVLIGFLVFFFTFIVSGMSFVRERTSGTLERTLCTPVRRHEVVFGYALGFAAVVVLQVTLIATFSVEVLDLLLVGHFAWLLLLVLLLALDALTLGMLLSAFARSEFQMMQLIPIVVVPQVFFSGLFPAETLSRPLRLLGRAFPLTYGAHGMREVMIRGGGFDRLWLDLLVLAGFGLFFLGLNVVALKKYRRL